MKTKRRKGRSVDASVPLRSASASADPSIGGGWGKPLMNLDFGRNGGPSSDKAPGESRVCNSAINSKVTSSRLR